MKRLDSRFSGIFARYAALLLSSLFNLGLFYLVFTPLTVYPVYWVTKLFFEASLVEGNIILIQNSIPIEMIPACIAGSAYYLLFALNMSVPGIKIRKRVKMILASFSLLLALNILRIIILIFVYMYGTSLFDTTHKIFWFGLSTVFVVGIWFAEVRIFRVKGIPVYSDIKSLVDSIKIKNSKDSKRSKKH